MSLLNWHRSTLEDGERWINHLSIKDKKADAQKGPIAIGNMIDSDD